MNTFGKRVKAARNSMGLTIAELAEIVNISDRFLQDIEADKRRASYDVLIRLSKALSVTIDFLLTGKDKILDEAHGFNLNDIIKMLNEDDASIVEESVKLTLKALRWNLKDKR